MESPTKKFRRATAKFIRKEIAATQDSHSLQYALIQAGVAIFLGLLFSFGLVSYFY